MRHKNEAASETQQSKRMARRFIIIWVCLCVLWWMVGALATLLEILLLCVAAAGLSLRTYGGINPGLGDEVLSGMVKLLVYSLAIAKSFVWIFVPALLEAALLVRTQRADTPTVSSPLGAVLLISLLGSLAIFFMDLGPAGQQGGQDIFFGDARRDLVGYALPALVASVSVPYIIRYWALFLNRVFADEAA